VALLNTTISNDFHHSLHLFDWERLFFEGGKWLMVQASAAMFISFLMNGGNMKIAAANPCGSGKGHSLL
jgi:hypothetical protein